jgi:hypothetical protein
MGPASRLSIRLAILLPWLYTSAGRAVEAPVQLLQEVFQSELVYPQEKGEIQVTLAPQFGKSEEQKTGDLGLEVEYGLTSAWQIAFGWNTVAIRDLPQEEAFTGTGDLEAGTQYSFMNRGGSNTHAALQFNVELPVGNVEEGLSEGFREYQPSLLLGKDLPGFYGAHVFTQTGLAFLDRQTHHDDPLEDEPAAHEFIWNNGIFIPWGKERLTFELNWTTNRWNHHGDESTLYITPGLVHQASKSFEWGVGMPIGLTEDSDDYRIIGMLTWEWSLTGDHDD